MQNIISHRKTQLDKQELLDNKLETLSCSTTVSKYLLYLQRLNRDQYHRVDKARFYETYSVINENLTEIDHEQNTLQTMFQTKKGSTSICEAIELHLIARDREDI